MCFTTDYPHPYNKIGDGPEGPEVRITADELDFVLSGAWLKKVTVIGGKFVKTPPPGLDSLQYPLRFQSVHAKGKMLIFSFQDTKMKMFAGLGMTGQFTFTQTSHSHLQFDLDIPPPYSPVMFYTDSRRFGNVSFSEQDLSARLAPSIFEIEEKEFLARAGKVRTKKDILSVLMDQEKLCSGIGNYLVAETLYAAKISPFRPFASLSASELGRIHQEARNIAEMSYLNSGLSIESFTLPNGEEGYFKSFLQVYSQVETPQGEKVVPALGSHGRTIWWVPTAQK